MAQIDWSSLCRESTTVVDPELSEKETDILFSARTLSNQPALFYVLVEHQSSVVPHMALRMARYTLAILERWRQEHPGQPLPVIIPHVLYHGDKAWDAPLRLEELFSIPSPEWLTFVPRARYSLHDLTTRQAEVLMAWAAPAFVRLAYLFLRFSRSEDFARQLSAWRPLFREILSEADVPEKLAGLVTYCFQVGGESLRATVLGVLDYVMGTGDAEELMRTVAEELIEQGRRQGATEGWVGGKAEGLVEGKAEGLVEGEAKGRAEGRAEDVLRILTLRGLRVESWARQRILSCTDLVTLDQWFERALNASAVSDVLGGDEAR